MTDAPTRSRRPASPAADEASELATELPTVLTRLNRRLRQTSGPLGVPPGHYPVLVALLDHSPATVTQLAAAEHVRVPSMTVLLGQLEAEGLIQKKVDGIDRRFVQVSLTRQGIAIARAARQLRGAWFAQRLSHLSAREITALQRALPALEHLIGVER
ncbi:MAG TPA: MarR family transcriptional regulator [Candidatus Nanopelagicaceae bacterium]|nr:MarR family transcriptional regulator [Candidatus Nanopelagicaceae bacterium]